MKALSFPGGIHPPDRKLPGYGKAVERHLPRGLLLFPMSQHIGAACSPVVKTGDRVLRGQKLADSEDFVSAPILSSVSGAIRDIADHMTISGRRELCIAVENDGRYELGSNLEPHEDYHRLSAAECRKIIREAGIVGMGGATFPTHVKLSPPPDKKIFYIIANGAECEPWLNSDNRLMLEHPGEILLGLKICLHLFPEAKGFVAVEDNKPDAAAHLEENLRSQDDGRISIAVLPSLYPQGAEKMLIYSLTGRKVPIGGLPADVGCIVLNVRTLYQIALAVTEGLPVEDRIVSVAGDVVEPKNLLVPLGTSVRELLDAVGGFIETPAKVLSGGPLMGTAFSSLDVPVVKGTSSIVALSPRSGLLPPETNCIRCGRCVAACPMCLLPSTLDFFVRGKAYEEFERYGGSSCIECGCCSYVCPADRRLVWAFREGKSAYRQLVRQKEISRKSGDKA